MSIVDFDRLDTGHTFEADICVIGSGAAGITLAKEFFGSRYSVLILEGGSKWSDPAYQDLYKSEIIGVRHQGIHTGRARVFGGTTTLWAGQTLPLDEIDFQKRSWVPDSGWPINRSELEPFYRRAETALHVERIHYDASNWPHRHIKLIPFDPRVFLPLVSQFSPKANFALAYRESIARSAEVQLVLHANATQLQTGQSGTGVERVEIRSLSGKHGWAKARFYVICCGGIESARLLLASDDSRPNGLANENDLVGRYFQDHAQALVAPIRTERLNQLKTALLPFISKGISYCPKAALAPQVQEAEKVLNVTVGLAFNEYVSENSPVESAKRLVRGVRHNKWDFAVLPNLLQVLKKPHEVAAAAFRRAVLGRPAFEMTGVPHIGVQCECAPIPSSRVMLSPERDPLGSRRARLDWRISPLVRETAVKATEAFAQELARLSLGRVDSKNYPLASDDFGWESHFSDANHHIGTTRMSDDPKKGVVDRNCRTHSVDNLFVASSSVFPTGGHSNPTFTILALAIRLADTLKNLLEKDEPAAVAGTMATRSS